ncbi:MAG: class I SAM-dependent methyltransferase [Desulfomonile tiedjei]|nr:class I SAM-dependent methyltransferase [Desulfomonile tiedjei]
MGINSKHIEEEAKAFDKRIGERIERGFVPDLRRTVQCDYFYKSFWRDPLFVRLYLGWIMDGLLSALKTHCGPKLSILDVGCGAGYMSLELARHGHNVEAIDISPGCIKTARETLADNPYKKGFGSLKYAVMPFHEAKGRYDVVMFCVSMHHMSKIDEVVKKAHGLLHPNGHLLFYEPCHERFRKQDAAQVALIRGILSLTGHWHDPTEVTPSMSNERALLRYVDEVHREYILERDKNEPEGQSPHDLEVSGQEILNAAKKRFVQIETRKGCSFTYRLLGGIRGSEEEIRNLAEFITAYERLAVSHGYISENMFYFVGKKK